MVGVIITCRLSTLTENTGCLSRQGIDLLSILIIICYLFLGVDHLIPGGELFFVKNIDQQKLKNK